MPLPIPAKWKQYFYKWVMILGSRSKLIKSDMKEAKVTLAAIEVKDIDGNFISMSKFVGKKLLIVNVDIRHSMPICNACRNNLLIS